MYGVLSYSFCAKQPPKFFFLKKGPFCYVQLPSFSTYLSYTMFDLAISLYTERQEI